MPAKDAMPEPANQKLCQVTFQPMGKSFAVPFGDSLFETAVEVGVEVDTVCGGNGSCGKCKVKFLTDPPPTAPLDHVHLAGAEIQQGIRLSCQVITQADMVVDVPPAGGRLGVQILHEGIQRDVELRPNIKKSSSLTNIRASETASPIGMPSRRHCPAGFGVSQPRSIGCVACQISFANQRG